jgi:hypothetical protein
MGPCGFLMQLSCKRLHKRVGSAAPPYFFPTKQRSLKMTALQSATFWDSQPSKLEKVLMWIPILGWALAGSLYQVRIRPISEDIRRQLQTRSEPSPSIWGEDSQRRSIAAYIVQQIQHEFGWPNHYFIPSDPLWIAAWAHEDGLDDVSFVLNIERHYKIKINIQKHFLRDSTLADLVDYIYNETTKQLTMPSSQLAKTRV